MTAFSRRILVLAGETAGGKTRAAIAIARRIGGEIVGADSVQVYRGLDIGSAKPDAAELDGIRHHMIDVRDADQPIDAAEYARLADEAICDVVARGAIPIVVGGTGLWLRALLRGLVPTPPVDLAIRKRLEDEADAEGLPALFARLAQIDVRAAGNIHPNDRFRIIRALEVFVQTGTPLGELQRLHALGGPRYDALSFVLTVPRDVLYARIEKRAEDMIARGFADEVRDLVARFGRDARPLGAVGYREMLGHVCDGAPIDVTLQAIRKATKTYARRQRTWFGSEPGFDRRVSTEDLLEGAASEEIRAFFPDRSAR